MLRHLRGLRYFSQEDRPESTGQEEAPLLLENIFSLFCIPHYENATMQQCNIATIRQNGFFFRFFRYLSILNNLFELGESN